MGLPTERPDGLRLSSLPGSWWRIDNESPDHWSWEPFPKPRYRFDALSGQVRVRYAARAAVAAARERYRDTGSYIPSDHADHVVAELGDRVRVLDVRNERTLDLLGLDDRISTGREPEIQKTAWELTDRACDWWGERIQGIVYRLRTTPSSLGLAFFEWTPLESARPVPLRAAADLLDELIIAHAFTIGFDR